MTLHRASLPFFLSHQQLGLDLLRDS